jgi:hypothetical protein
MNYNNFSKLLFVPSLLAILTLTSCQKGAEPGDLPAIPDEVKDSTLLIKRLSYAYNIGEPYEDSLIETFSYDTVNRKIIITWITPVDNYPVTGTRAEFIYNAKGLISDIVYTYPVGYIPQAYDYTEINFTYDAENILQKIVAQDGDGTIESGTFTRTKLSSGNYQLTWSDVAGDDEDSTFRRAEFDKDGKAIISYIEYFYHASPGDTNVYKTTFLDSIVYDAGGSVVKVFRKVEDASQNISLDFTFYEYSRHTKGDQLYNQRQVLMNGIANIPFGDYDDILEDAFGILSFSAAYESILYSKYPVQSVKGRMSDGSFQTFSSNPTFDSKNRLVKLPAFFHDYGFEPTEYRISYYK